jgi:peroxiredoxin
LEVTGSAPFAGRQTRDDRAWPASGARLLAHDGTVVDIRELAEKSPLVMYFYPGTAASPEDGHASREVDQAQHRAFSSHHPDFLALNCSVFGVSSQPREQQHATTACEIEHLLLSDPCARLAREFNLRTFTVDGARWYCRSVVVLVGKLWHVISTLRSVQASPAQAIGWMRAQGI